MLYLHPLIKESRYFMKIDKNKEANMILKLTEGFVFEPLVDNLIERGSIGMIVGPAKSKKSMLALNLAFCITTGESFMGHEVTKQKERVLYVNLELTQQALGVRLRAMQIRFNSQNLKDMSFVNTEDFIGDEQLINSRKGIVNKEPFDRLIEASVEWGATTIIIDPLYYVVGEENDNTLVTQVLKQFSKIRSKTSCTIIVVHHTKKDKTDWSDPFQAGRGASSIGGFFEWVLGIEPLNDDDNSTARLHHGSRNLKSAKTTKIIFDSISLSWSGFDEKSLLNILDEIMGDDIEIPTNNFYERCKDKIGNKNKVNMLLDESKTLERIRAHRGQKAVVKRVL
jgi:archaellum biogenesis ATPase FlaH